jgi:hypothetical protein
MKTQMTLYDAASISIKQADELIKQLKIRVKE